MAALPHPPARRRAVPGETLTVPMDGSDVEWVDRLIMTREVIAGGFEPLVPAYDRG